MITWFAIALISAAMLVAVVCLAVFLRGRAPNDYSIGGTLLIGLLLVAQIVISIVAPMTGNHAVGDPLEYWMYLITAAVLPFGAALWALVDRRRSAGLVLMMVSLAVAIMTYRMLVIWG